MSGNVEDLMRVLEDALEPENNPLQTGVWRTCIYLSAWDWLDGGADGLELLSLQSKACKGAMRGHPGLKKALTYRNRCTKPENDDVLQRLYADVENRRIDCVMVASISCLGSNFSEAMFFAGNVLIPAGFRLIDVARGFDSLHDEYKPFYDVVYRDYRMASGVRDDKEV